MVGSAVGHQRRVDRELSVFQAPRLTHNAYVLTPSRKLSGTNKVKSHRRDSRCADGDGQVVFGRATRHHLSTIGTGDRINDLYAVLIKPTIQCE